MNIKDCVVVSRFFQKEYAVRNLYTKYNLKNTKSELISNVENLCSLLPPLKQPLSFREQIAIINFFLRKHYHDSYYGSGYSLPQEDIYSIREEEFLNDFFDVDKVYRILIENSQTLDFLFKISAQMGVYCTEVLFLEQDNKILQYSMEDIEKYTRAEFPMFKHCYEDQEYYVSLSAAEYAIHYENPVSQFTTSKQASSFDNEYDVFFVNTDAQEFSIGKAMVAIERDLTFFALSQKLLGGRSLTDEDWDYYKKHNSFISPQDIDPKRFKRRLHGLALWDLKHLSGKNTVKSIKEAFYQLHLEPGFCAVWAPTNYDPPINSWTRAAIEYNCDKCDSCFAQASAWHNTTKKCINDNRIYPHTKK